MTCRAFLGNKNAFIVFSKFILFSDGLFMPSDRRGKLIGWKQIYFLRRCMLISSKCGVSWVVLLFILITWRLHLHGQQGRITPSNLHSRFLPTVYWQRGCNFIDLREWASRILMVVVGSSFHNTPFLCDFSIRGLVILFSWWITRHCSQLLLVY